MYFHFLNLHLIQVSYGKVIQVWYVTYFIALFFPAPCALSGVFREVEISVFSFANLP